MSNAKPTRRTAQDRVVDFLACVCLVAGIVAGLMIWSF